MVLTLIESNRRISGAWDSALIHLIASCRGDSFTANTDRIRRVLALSDRLLDLSRQKKGWTIDSLSAVLTRTIHDPAMKVRIAPDLIVSDYDFMIAIDHNLTKKAR